MLIFRQLFDPQSSTYSYLLGDARAKEAVLIDPVFEHVRRDAALIAELELKLIATLETHIHADHVTGAWLLKRQFDSAICLSAASGAEGADRYLAHGDRVQFGSRYLETRATPGHTHGCVTYVLDDESMAFTGDCLLIRGSGRTDFPQGDPPEMYRSVRSQTPPLGRRHGAKLIPLGQLTARAGELARDRPVVAVCRSGARSAHASVLLQRAGFTEVANLAGGMPRWRAEGYPVDGGKV